MAGYIGFENFLNSNKITSTKILGLLQKNYVVDKVINNTYNHRQLLVIQKVTLNGSQLLK